MVKFLKVHQSAHILYVVMKSDMIAGTIYMYNLIHTSKRPFLTVKYYESQDHDLQLIQLYSVIYNFVELWRYRFLVEPRLGLRKHTQGRALTWPWILKASSGFTHRQGEERWNRRDTLLSSSLWVNRQMPAMQIEVCG